MERILSESSEDNDIPESPTRVTAACVLKLGDRFSSAEDIILKIEEYQQAIKSMYYVRDLCTIETARKKGITRRMHPPLKYYILKFCCIHGGKNFKSRATGMRSSSTFQDRCPAHILFTLDADGSHLIVTRISEVHSHVCLKPLFKSLPRERSLSTAERAKVKTLLELGANKKKVKESIFQETQKQKNVLLKDLSNIMAQPEGQNNLQRIVDELQEKCEAEVHVFEENNTFKGLFFVTKRMKKSMQAFCEFVGIDATFKLLNIRAPVYLMVVEDSEGSTEIVAV